MEMGEVASHNMAYSCLLPAIYWPSQNMRGESGHLVIDNHCSSYCHRNLWKGKVNTN